MIISLFLLQTMASLEIESVPQGWLPLPDKDPRVDGWLLLGNPAPIVTILACYVYIVKASKVQRRESMGKLNEEISN